MNKRILRNTILRLFPALLLTAGALGACNSEATDQPDYEPANSVAVSAFSLSANAKVLSNLDSVFFSIDLNHGIIFNADSLPAGTPVDRLVTKITFPSTVSKAEITMTGGQTRTGTVDYKTSPGDSIDFTGKVTLTLSSDDGSLSKSYDLRVNVHKMVADSLMWDNTSLTLLPSGSGDDAMPVAQRTVSMADKVYTLLSEADGSFSMAVTADPASSAWSVTPLSLPFTPQTRSMAAADATLYILSETGDLYSSADGISWTACGVNWSAIIGGFGDAVLGIRPESGHLYHDIYPRPAGFNETEIPADFPTSGMSDFHSFTSRWAVDPIGLFIGGSRDGRLSDATWAYDGSDWAKISHKPLPAMEGALMLPYLNYRQTATSWVQTEFSVLLAFGGRLEDGTLNRTVYISYDNGVNWMKADSLLQLPEFMPTLTDADAVISSIGMEADLNDRWQTRDVRVSPAVKRLTYVTDGSNISWDCPYIYLFGGNEASGRFNYYIWRAVLARLTFAPLF